MKKYLKIMFASINAFALMACSGGSTIDIGGGTGVVTSVTLNETSLVLEIGDTYQLSATVEATDDYVTEWFTSNKNVVSVTKEGLIEAVNAGSAYVTVISGDKSANCHIVVNGATYTDDITYFALSRTSLTMTTGSSIQLSYETVPANAIITVNWSSSDESIVGVSNAGLLTAYKAGEADITAKYSDDLTSTCHVVVSDQSTIGDFTITLNESTKSLMVGNTFQLNATVSSPATVNWSTSNSSRATVSSNGLVTAVSAGTVTISASANGVTASCVFTIINNNPDIPDTDPDVIIYFFMDYNSYDLEDETGTKKLAEFEWYSEVPLSKSGLVPNNPTSAPDPAFPYFVGWSDHTIIDTKDDLWNIETDVVPLGTYFLALYGIWSDVEDFSL